MTRRSKHELRTMMIDAGCTLLERRGLAFDPPSLTYATVFAHLEQTEGIVLHRSQVHGRIWESQAHYRADVIAAAIENMAPGSSEIDDLVRALAGADQPAHVRVLANAWVDAASAVARDKVDADLRYDLLIAAMALSRPDGTTPAAIVDATEQKAQARMEHNEWRFGAVADNLGVTPDPEHGLSPEQAYQLMSRNASAFLEGTRLLESVDHPVVPPFEVTDDDGNPQVRDPATLGLCIMVEQLYGL